MLAATEIAEYHFQVRNPAKHLHITPSITMNSLLSTNEFAAPNYITIFDKEEVNIYDANNTIIAVTRGAILQGWKCPTSGLWRIPLVNMVRNNNTDTVIVNQHAHHPPMASTTSTNSRRNQSWSVITTQLQDSPRILHGSRESKTNRLHLGQD